MRYKIYYVPEAPHRWWELSAWAAGRTSHSGVFRTFEEAREYFLDTAIALDNEESMLVHNAKQKNTTFQLIIPMIFFVREDFPLFNIDLVYDMNLVNRKMYTLFRNKIGLS